MKSSIQQAGYFGATGRKVAMALILASLISGGAISSAFADNDGGQGRGAKHGNKHQREWRGDRHDNGYRPEYRRPYVYAEPVYVPPPVYYEPRQSPGISFFFPLDLRR
jgi:hypothetical protein